MRKVLLIQFFTTQTLLVSHIYRSFKKKSYSGPGCALDLVFQVPVTLGSPCPRRCHTLQGSVTFVPDTLLYLAVS